MTSESKSARKVRFNLPDSKSTVNEIKPPTASQGVQRNNNNNKNGSLPKKQTFSKTSAVIVNKNAIPAQKKSLSGNSVKSLPKISHRPLSTSNKTGVSHCNNNIQNSVPKIRPKSSLGRSLSFSSKKILAPGSEQQQQHHKKRYSDSFLYFTENIPLLHITEPDYQPVVCIERPVATKKSNQRLLKIPVADDDSFVIQCSKSGKESEILNDLERLDLSKRKNEAMFWDFVEQWRLSFSANKFEQYKNVLAATTPVRKDSCSKPDLKSSLIQNTSRAKAFKMGLDQVPLVTQLLRACRDANDQLLKEVFRQILSNGISKDDLNISDNSGRTALSYICSTNLHKFLELMLQLPGIDVNKADNEGNTPLHFAAQAGQTEAVNLLITKSHHLIIDAKNSLGFTPLMKAALQGRTRCAKLLLFAGASPLEVDPCRNLRADQWARFVGRHTTAETIEECARNKLLGPTDIDSYEMSKVIPKTRTDKSEEKSTVPKASHQVIASSGIEDSIDTAPYLAVHGATIANNLTAIRPKPTPVPRLEITYAQNNALIKKYESIYGITAEELQTGSRNQHPRTMAK